MTASTAPWTSTGTPLDRLRSEIARVEALLKAYTARRADEEPQSEREKYWLLCDSAVERLLTESLAHPRDRGPEESHWVSEYALLNGDGKSAADDLIKGLCLSRFEFEALLLCALPDLDFRFRHWFELLQSDPSRSHLTVWRACDILEPVFPSSAECRALFHVNGTLRRLGLVSVDVQNPGESVLNSTVRVEERVIAHLLGHDTFDGRLHGILTRSAELSKAPGNALQVFCEHIKMKSFMGEPVRILLQSADARRTVHAAWAMARSARRTLLEFDCARAVLQPAGLRSLADLALREARLAPAAVLFRNASAILPLDPPASAAHCAALVEAIAAHPGLAIVELPTATGSGAFPSSLFIPIPLPTPTYDDRLALWQTHLQSEIEDSSAVAQHLAGTFLLTEDEIDNALAAARNLARRDRPFSGSLTPDALFEACRHQTGKRLVAMAQRLEPRPGLSLSEVVLPPPNYRQLEELSNRIRHRRHVHGSMGFDHRLRLGRGLMALFAGPSGTGKTMAAEVLASEQRCDLYKVDLSSVVSKWVGETEKNLNRIFDEAEHCQGMLFFDEADALFGQRGEVKEARDRWANLEVNFLLQRIEEFSGIVILATNLRSNIDPAFSRRFHSIVDFPQPDEHARCAIWKRTLPGAEFVCLDEREIRLVAARFDLSGGMIRNAVLDASYRAVENGTKIGLREVASAAAREYQKIGRPVTRSEFGETLYQIALEEVLAPVARNQSS